MMPTPKIFAALTGSAVLMSSMAISEGASAQSAQCVWYADMALKQQQRNEHKGCGFKGPEWSYDRQAHLTWCATQSPDIWKAQAQKREKMLAGCK